MATPVTICNLALSRIGDSATISSIAPPDGSEQAEACSRFYPVALATCLDAHNWAFATRRATLAELSSGMVEKGQWHHAFGLPGDCLRVIDIRPASTSAGEELKSILRFKPPTMKPEEFEVVGSSFGRAILTDLEAVEIRYICSEPKPSQFSPLFADALAWLLASYLAGETIRGDSAFNYGTNCLKQFQTMIASAREQDARQNRVHIRHVPEWIARR